MTEKELLTARQSIVQKLTQARLEKGLSQEQLAKRIGTQRSNICRIEKGTQNLSLDLMIKIAEALDKDVSVMLEERSSTMEKEYSLRLYDETLLTFTLEERGLEGLQATILHTETAKQKLFPLDLELTNEGVVKWLERRVIPKNRQFVDEILKTLGLSVNNTKGIIDVCMGLSLNDSYWVVPADLTASMPIITSMKTASPKRCHWWLIPAWAQSGGILHLAGADYQRYAAEGLEVRGG